MLKMFTHSLTHSLTLVVLLAVPANAVGAEALPRPIPKGHVDIRGIPGIKVVRALFWVSYDVQAKRMRLDIRSTKCRQSFPEDELILKELIKKNWSLDYMSGGVPIKVEFGGNSFDPFWYDRENGDGAAEKAIAALRKS